MDDRCGFRISEMETIGNARLRNDNFSLKPGDRSHHKTSRGFPKRSPTRCFWHHCCRLLKEGNPTFRQHRLNIGNQRETLKHPKRVIHPAHLLSSSASFCLLIGILSLLVLPSSISTSGDLYKAAPSSQQHNKYSSQCKYPSGCPQKF